MKKVYIQPQSVLHELCTTHILAASGGTTPPGGSWSAEDLPEDYDEVGVGGGSKVPD